MTTFSSLTTAQRADIHLQARRQAHLLRRAAIADFWCGAYRLAAHALRATQHASHPVAPQSNRSAGV